MSTTFSAEFMGRARSTTCRTRPVDEVREAPGLATASTWAGPFERSQTPGSGQRRPGRLAALPDLRHLDLPVRGYGILYRYGLFRSSSTTGGPDRAPSRPGGWSEGYPSSSGAVSERARIVSYAIPGPCVLLRHRDHRLRHQERPLRL